MARFMIEPHPTSIPSIIAWHVKDLYAPAGRGPLVIAICSSEQQAHVVADALSAYYARIQVRLSAYAAKRRKQN